MQQPYLIDINLIKLKREREKLNSKALLSLSQAGGEHFHSKNSSTHLTTSHTGNVSSTENSITFSPEAGDNYKLAAIRQYLQIFTTNTNWYFSSR